MPSSPSPTDLLQDLIKRAMRAGADAADAMLADAASLSVGCRFGKIETLERAESGHLGLRVFIGQRQAMVSTTDRREAMLNELVERAVAMAKLAPEDPFCGLADPAVIAKTWPKLELADSKEPTADQLIGWTREAEDAARAVKGVSNSEGSDAGFGRTHVYLAASNGFAGGDSRTSTSLSASVLAGDGTAMERDDDWASKVFMDDMPAPASIGRNAGEKAVRRLGGRKMPTGRYPVVFDSRIAGGLVGQLAGAVSGASIARGTSFLKDRLGQQIFSSAINIIDDPFRAKGLRSKPFDAEGVLPRSRKLIDQGVLTTWLLDSRSGRQLKMASTGHAARGAGGSPTPSASNLYMEAGPLSFDELIRDIAQGFYVTETMGMGVNGVTGDYSQAASGFWIENGVVAFPVNEMTIASNLKDMYLNLTAANDLEFRRGVDSPSLRVEGMTVAGV